MDFILVLVSMGRDSSIGIATGYGLDGPGARFFAHVQTGPGAHPESCTTGTGSFPGVKRPGRDTDHTPLLAPKSGKGRAIPLSTLWACSDLQRDCFTSTFILVSTIQVTNSLKFLHTCILGTHLYLVVIDVT
jgi:hypothetical protein